MTDQTSRAVEGPLDATVQQMRGACDLHPAAAKNLVTTDPERAAAELWWLRTQQAKADQVFLEKLFTLLRENDIEIAYTAADDGVHVLRQGRLIFNGWLDDSAACQMPNV